MSVTSMGADRSADMETRIMFLSGYLTRAVRNDNYFVLDAVEVMKKHGVTTNATLHKYAKMLLESKELQEKFALSPQALELCRRLEQESGEMARRNAKQKSSERRILNKAKGTRK